MAQKTQTPQVLILFVLILIVGIASMVRFLKTNPQVSIPDIQITQTDTQPPSTPSPVPDVPFVSYTPVKLPQKTAYRIILLGDSMTVALGPYADQLREVIKKKYPHIDLIMENHSAPSSNIGSLQDRLLSKSDQAGASFDPVLGKPFDIIVIESFGYNPLSHLGRAEGLNKASESLSNAMRILVREQPNALIVFLATIAPSHTMYGVGSVKLTPTQRDEWATERDLYIENHIAFAKAHNIPLVDVYSQTKDKNGNGLLKYINATDHVHPSHPGVLLIQDELAKYFIEAKVFEE